MSTGTVSVAVDPTRVGGDAPPTPLPPLGYLAGIDDEHPFLPITATLGDPQCRHCFGWSDDYRHGQVRHG